MWKMWHTNVVILIVQLTERNFGMDFSIKIDYYTPRSQSLGLSMIEILGYYW